MGHIQKTTVAYFHPSSTNKTGADAYYNGVELVDNPFDGQDGLFWETGWYTAHSDEHGD
jgi:hypothetical protein